MPFWFWSRWSSIHVLYWGSEKKISGGIVPDGGKCFFAAAKKASFSVLPARTGFTSS